MRLKLITVLALALLLSGCNATKQAGSQPSTTDVQGNWVITASEVGSPNSVFTLSLVTSPCNVTAPIGTFTVQGPACFIADNDTGQGSISGTGSFFYPPQGVLMGVSQNPSPGNAAVNLLFVEADQFGDAVVFDGSGTVNGKVITGKWTCDPNSPVCSGLSGTFTGTEN